jgi:hypothetical protein
VVLLVTRHQFLSMLHEILKPRGYLEIGVFAGDSLRLANCPAIGVDPLPKVHGNSRFRIYPMTSDKFFHVYDPIVDILGEDHLDLVFIDGMHLFEYALRDFQNVEQYANPRTVVVFDDVLPRNQHEAAREQCPGDWTGDVWKVPKLLEAHRRNLKQHWVNTVPTGTYVVYGFTEPGYDIYTKIKSLGLEAWETVPDDVINRVDAVEPNWVLGQILLTLKG